MRKSGSIRRSCHGRTPLSPDNRPASGEEVPPGKYHPTDMQLPRIRPGSALPACAAVLVSTHILWGKTSIPSPGRTVRVGPEGRWCHNSKVFSIHGGNPSGSRRDDPTTAEPGAAPRAVARSARRPADASPRIRREGTRGRIESGPASRRKTVTPEELQQYQAPPPEGRWFPLSHGHVLSVVARTLTEAGYAIVKQQLGVMRDGSRFFGTLDLASPVAEGVSLAVGIRNSVDKSFPARLLRGLAGLLLRQPRVSLGAARPAEAHHPRRARLHAGASSRRSPRSTRSASRRRPGPSGSARRSSTRTWPTP